MVYASLARNGAVALGLTLVLAAGASWAAGGNGSLRQSCAADLRNLCAGTKPGSGRLKACMRDSADRLSAGCRQALQAAKANHQ